MLKIKQALLSDASLLLALSRRALDAECAANPLLSALRRGAPEPDFSGLDALIAYEDFSPSRVRLTAHLATAKGFILPCTAAFSAGAGAQRLRRALLRPDPPRENAQGAPAALRRAPRGKA